MFCHLHVHSHWSLLAGASGIGELLNRAVEQGCHALALTDINNVYGAIPFYLEATARGVKPIIGATITKAHGLQPVGFKSGAAGALVALSRDRDGYANLCRLLTARHLDEDFDLLSAAQRCQEGLIYLCDDAEMLRRLAPRIEPNALYAELVRFGGDAERARLRELYKTARELKVPLVATNAVAFHDPSRHDLHRVLLAIGRNGLLDQLPAEAVAPPDAYLKSPAQMSELFAACPEAIANTARIAERCNLDFELDRPRFPRCELPEGETPFSHLCKLAFAGLARRYGTISPGAMERLQRELSVIDRLGFPEYFLIVHDIVAYARNKDIACVGRGSAGDSLVSYCLGITQVDPLAHDLYFERFLNESRTDVPDIDLDFDWRFRDDVLDYIYRRYGPSRTAMICTFNTFAARSAFREIAKAMGLPPRRIGALADKLPHDSAASGLREAILSFPECRGFPLNDPQVARIVELAEAIDGFPRHLGIHVGGVVVADRELTHYVPLQRAAKGIVITQFDMGPIERLGLVKMDILAQRSLAIVKDTVRHVREIRGVELDLERLPDRDPPTVELLRAGRTIGCFQIESPGMRNLLAMLKAECRMDVIIALSLIRPGPSSSGMKEHYVRRRLGLEEPTYPHPALREVLGDTYGVMLYQEDVMRVAQAVAGFTMATGDELRKAVSKKRSPERFAKLREQFLEGAARNPPAAGSPQEAARLWELISNFAAYSYNKAHACTYGHISYQCVYLKAHHPAEFMAAVLSNIGGYYERREYLEEARRLGVPILLPDVSASDVTFTPEVIPVHVVEATRVGEATPPAPTAPPVVRTDTAVRVGLMQVRGLSEKNMLAILRQRRRRPFRDLEDLVQRVPLSVEEARNLVLCGACDGFGASRPELLWRLELILQKVRALREQGTAELFESLPDDGGAALPAERFPRLDDYDAGRKIELELAYLDLAASDNPLVRYREQLSRWPVVPSSELSRQVGRTVWIAGFIIAMRRARTKTDEFMKFISLEDTAGVVEVTLFPDAYRRLGHRISTVGPYLVRGQVESHHGAITLNGVDLRLLDADEDGDARHADEPWLAELSWDQIESVEQRALPAPPQRPN